MKYRVEQLATLCDVSVDTVRYYQSSGLLPPPRREGRVAIYGDEHRDRIRRIRALAHKGLSLAVIRRVLEGTLRRPDIDLATAVAAAQVDGEDTDWLTLEEVATHTGVPTALLREMERAGFALGRKVDGIEHYSRADVDVVRHGLRLLEAGLPLDGLLALATDYDEATRGVAERAVEMFARHLRDPVQVAANSEEEAAERLVGVFRELLPVVTALVAQHFRRALLDVAQDQLEQVGDDDDLQPPGPAELLPSKGGTG